MAKIGELCEIQAALKIEFHIKNFSTLSVETNIRYSSHNFYFCGASWSIRIYPNGETRNNSEDYLSAFLSRRSIGYPVKLDFTLGIKNLEGNEEFKIKRTRLFNTIQGWGEAELIRKEILTSRKDQLLPQDTLTIICTVSNNEENSVPGSLFSHLQDVSNNLIDIYKKEKRTDLLLNVNGGSIRAHKLILESRSPVFAAMFNHDTLENQTGEITIQDVDKSAMEAVLHQLYSGTLESLTTDNAISVYAAAEKYDVKDVRDMCMDFISKNLSVEWICDVVQFAETYHKDELGQLARKYFRDNGAKIVETDKWKTFMQENHDLGVEILTSVVKTFPATSS